MLSLHNKQLTQFVEKQNQALELNITNKTTYSDKLTLALALGKSTFMQSNLHQM